MKKILFALLFILPLAGCSPMASLMVKDERMGSGPVATDGKATVVFIRPSYHGDVIDAGVFMLNKDDETFIGKVGSHEGVSVAVEPGEHLFMVTDQNIHYRRLMKANVEAGKVYYAVVSPRGWPAIIFALLPVKADPSSYFKHSDLPGWLDATVWVKKAPSADSWFKGAKARVHAARSAAQTDWLATGKDLDHTLALDTGDAYTR